MSVLASIRRTCFPRHLCRAREQFPVAFAGAVANQPLTEMVSWRGVAKKRRKQEAGKAVNQMPVNCCDHATIVARRQPLFGFRSRPLPAWTASTFEKPDQAPGRPQLLSDPYKRLLDAGSPRLNGQTESIRESQDAIRNRKTRFERHLRS